LARFLTHEYKAKPAPRRPCRYEANLPDFRNLGVVLRILLLVNGLALVAVLCATQSRPCSANSWTWRCGSSFR
jgi:hypothetical protein